MLTYMGKKNLLTKIDREDLIKAGMKEHHYILDNELELKVILFSYKVVTEVVLCSIKENAGSYELYVNNNLILIEKNYKILLKKFKRRVLQLSKKERNNNG